MDVGDTCTTYRAMEMSQVTDGGSMMELGDTPMIAEAGGLAIGVLRDTDATMVEVVEDGMDQVQGIEFVGEDPRLEVGGPDGVQSETQTQHQPQPNQPQPQPTPWEPINHEPMNRMQPQQVHYHYHYYYCCGGDGGGGNHHHQHHHQHHNGGQSHGRPPDNQWGLNGPSNNQVRSCNRVPVIRRVGA